MTNDMIECIAIALWVAEWDRASGFPGNRKAKNWPDNSTDTHMVWRRVARTAIEAMREPTLSMCVAGAKADKLHCSLSDRDEEKSITPDDAARIWRAMVDAARSSAGAEKQENEQ